LREGAKLAQLCRAEVFLLAVVELSPITSPDAGLTIPIHEQTANYESILAEGVEHLKALGFSPNARFEMGDPGQEIAEFASSSVIGCKDRWHDGGSALSAATWSSVFTAACWLPKRRSATMNLSS
jgi:hypothetical protein